MNMDELFELLKAKEPVEGVHVVCDSMVPEGGMYLLVSPQLWTWIQKNMKEKEAE
jgi:hypothetical protein